MDIPTIYLTQEEFNSLKESNSSAYDQDECKNLCKTGQWLYINKNSKDYSCAVIEIIGI